MNSLLDDPSVKFTDRDFRAWVSILEGHRKTEEHAKRLRRTVAQEVGFDAIHPDNVRSGNVIRTRTGCWYEVRTSHTYTEDDRRYRRFYFADAEGHYDVEVESESWPIDPQSVIVRIPDTSGEPF